MERWPTSASTRGDGSGGDNARVITYAKLARSVCWMLWQSLHVSCLLELPISESTTGLVSSVLSISSITTYSINAHASCRRIVPTILAMQTCRCDPKRTRLLPLILLSTSLLPSSILLSPLLLRIFFVSVAYSTQSKSLQWPKRLRLAT